MTETNLSARVFETALAAERPVSALLDIATDLVKKDEVEGFHDIDVMLNGLFIDFMRKGNRNDFDSFIRDILAFLDSPKGDQLKSIPGGERYFHRWSHFHDLSQAALENHDPQSTMRFVASKKQGHKLMEVLFAHEDGLRHKSLAKELGISPQNLSKLLREFKESGLISMYREKGSTFVKLTFIGKAFMSETKDLSEEREVSTCEAADSLDKEIEDRIGPFAQYPHPKELLFGKVA